MGTAVFYRIRHQISMLAKMIEIVRPSSVIKLYSWFGQNTPVAWKSTFWSKMEISSVFQNFTQNSCPKSSFFCKIGTIFAISIYYLALLLGTYYLWPQKLGDLELLKAYYGPSVWVSNKLQLETKNGYRGVYASRPIRKHEFLVKGYREGVICASDITKKFPELHFVTYSMVGELPARVFGKFLIQIFLIFRNF